MLLFFLKKNLPESCYGSPESMGACNPFTVIPVSMKYHKRGENTSNFTMKTKVAFFTFLSDMWGGLQRGSQAH